ncbi:MAG: Kae1-associated serine/threonine protein kinase [Candidatus Aenigmarchaeota archaeon]|nr:Kae1-associated serine/threonine protein kinase [Candidatus Aenigmarchaeota archaeon]
MEIARGAEAVVTVDGDVAKERIAKRYRVPELDQRLRAERTKTEARLLDAARRAGVPVPVVRSVEKHILRMEFIEGSKLRDIFDGMTEEQLRTTARAIGKHVAALHRNNIIHGDLTTSNIIVARDNIYFIDFGLGKFSSDVEDRATDLHLLHGAILSTHQAIAKKLWVDITTGYMENFKGASAVVKRLHAVERRGRYSRRVG